MTDNNSWPNGLKKTKQRETVLSILMQADKPISALDIHSRVLKEGYKVWLSTIYRILEIFEKYNLVVKNTVLDNETVLYELNSHEHKHYAVCLGCHSITPISDCPMKNFSDNIEDDSFHVTGHKLEIYGYCKHCKDTISKK